MSKYSAAMKTMLRKKSLRKVGQGRKLNKSSVISSRDVILQSYSSTHFQKVRYRVKAHPKQQNVQLHLFGLLHNSLSSQWKTMFIFIARYWYAWVQLNYIEIK